MNDSTHPIDLQLFAGEPDASAGEPEVREEEVPAAASAEAAEAAEHQEGAALSWQEVLKNPEFKKNISGIVAGRLAKANAENAALRKELTELRSALPAAEAAGSAPETEASGLDPHRDAAPAEDTGDGSPGPDALEARLQKLEELFRLREDALEQQTREQQLRSHYDTLRRQAEELQRQLPEFSLENALEDREFLRLTSPEVGLGVEGAWYALHHEGLRQEAAGEAARAISESIRAGAGIPAENGTVPRGAVSSQPRLYRSMSPEERKLQEQLIRSGMKF